MLAHLSRPSSMLALITLCTLAGPSASAQSCTLEYRRADNMWAPKGEPSPSLGTESLTLAKGTGKDFLTDWKYEKMRNDGTIYYGSHLRVATNRGTIPMRLFTVMLKRTDTWDAYSKLTQGFIVIQPGETKLMRDDLYNVGCL